MNKATVDIQGMTCNHCKMAVERGISEVTGVQSVQVDLPAKKAHVSWEEPATLAAIRRAVEDAGYTAM